MRSPDFEVMSGGEDVERYFASTTDHSEFIRWMRRTGTPPPGEVSVEATDSAGTDP